MRAWICLLAVALAAFTQPQATAVERIPFDVLYLARDGDEVRTSAFEQLFGERFRSCTVKQREDFQVEYLDEIDVVVLDWSQSERSAKPVSPVGSLAQWSTPTVLLVSAGLLMADAWQIIG